jgi:TatD DNase family protein
MDQRPHLPHHRFAWTTAAPPHRNPSAGTPQVRAGDSIGQLSLVDTHCHLDLRQFDGDRDEAVARAEAVGVRIIVNPGIDLASCERALALAERHPGVYVAVGVHPNDSAGFDDGTAAALRRLASHPKVVAIGEIGLDYYRERVPHEQQKTVLRTQLELAAELGLPVVLHSRDSNADLLCELSQWGAAIRKKRGATGMIGVWHAFSGDLAEAEAAYELGLTLGLGGPVTFQNARGLRALVPQLRPDRLLLETDSPYLAPHPHRGERNEPGYVLLVAQALASLYGIDVAAVAVQTTATALGCFAPKLHRYCETIERWDK